MRSSTFYRNSLSVWGSAKILNEAGKSYARSLELIPSRAAHGELSAIHGAQRANQLFQVAGSRASADLIYFEIDDLLGWLREHKTLSGIQRVAVGIIRTILAEVLVRDEGRYAFIRSRDDSGAFWQLWPSDMNDIIEYATSSEVERRQLTRLLDHAEQGAAEVKPSPGQCYFILGAFWAFNGDATRYARLKRAGVSVGVYIYDLIPVTHPDLNGVVDERASNHCSKPSSCNASRSAPLHSAYKRRSRNSRANRWIPS